MTSDRPYRKGLDISIAIKEMRKNVDSQFDPMLAEEFIGFMEECAFYDPCPSLDTCSIFREITRNIISKAYEMQYCRTNFKARARYKFKKKKERPENLLPDGSFLSQ